MRTFTKDQIDQIKRVLADSNVRVVVAKSQIRDELSEREAQVRAWKPKNAGVKPAFVTTLKMIRAYGYSNDRYGWTS